ncbi:hypothetical protein D3C72_2136590 [compost metagenome]
MHIVDLFKDQCRPATGWFALNPGRACFLETIQNLTADFVANILSGVEAHTLAQPDHPGAKNKDQHQHDKRHQ